MDECLFCKIAAGEIPSSRVYDADGVYAFRDIAPQAPTHILVIPKEHIGSISEIREDQAPIVSRCLTAIAEVAAQEGLENGYRVISNVGEDAGQSVKHLHFHILGGRRMPDQMV